MSTFHTDDDGEIVAGFALPMGELRDGITMKEIVNVMETMTNIMKRIEFVVQHNLLLDHAPDEELDVIFSRWENEMTDEQRERFWDPQRLNTLYAIRDAAEMICNRFLATAGISTIDEINVDDLIGEDDE